MRLARTVSPRQHPLSSPVPLHGETISTGATSVTQSMEHLIHFMPFDSIPIFLRFICYNTKKHKLPSTGDTSHGHALSGRTSHSIGGRDHATQTRTAAHPPLSVPWWVRRFGAFQDDPIYDEAMRLGVAYRQSQPTPGEKIGVRLEWHFLVLKYSFPPATRRRESKIGGILGVSGMFYTLTLRSVSRVVTSFWP